MLSDKYVFNPQTLQSPLSPMSQPILPKEALQTALNRPVKDIKWLAGDGSDRCYYRVLFNDKLESLVLMLLGTEDVKALTEHKYDWLIVQKILSDYGIKTPKPVAVLSEHKCIVIEDYGDLMFETKIHELLKKSDDKAIKQHYRSAVDLVVKMLRLKPNPQEVWCQRAFDTNRLVWELEFFKKHFLQDYLKLSLSTQEQALFAHEANQLSEIMASESNYFVHRDFHSRNIMLKNNGLAVIDFQDARLGSPSYDLVSLFYDSYIPFTVEARKTLMDEAIEQLSLSLDQKIVQKIKNNWPLVLLQRQLKVLGSFAYLGLVKNKLLYQQYMPVALDTILYSNVADTRWPFLSKTLPLKLAKALL